MWQDLPKSGKGSWAACYTHYTSGLVGTMALPHSHEFSIVCEVTCCVNGGYDSKPVSDKWGRKLRIISNFQEQSLYTAARTIY